MSSLNQVGGGQNGKAEPIQGSTKENTGEGKEEIFQGPCGHKKESLIPASRGRKRYGELLL